MALAVTMMSCLLAGSWKSVRYHGLRSPEEESGSTGGDFGNALGERRLGDGFEGIGRRDAERGAVETGDEWGVVEECGGGEFGAAEALVEFEGVEVASAGDDGLIAAHEQRRGDLGFELLRFVVVLDLAVEVGDGADALPRGGVVGLRVEEAALGRDLGAPHLLAEPTGHFAAAEVELHESFAAVIGGDGPGVGIVGVLARDDSEGGIRAFDAVDGVTIARIDDHDLRRRALEHYEQQRLLVERLGGEGGGAFVEADDFGRRRRRLAHARGAVDVHHVVVRGEDGEEACVGEEDGLFDGFGEFDDAVGGECVFCGRVGNGWSWLFRSCGLGG